MSNSICFNYWKILPVAHEECITVVILSNLKDSYDTDIEILPVIRHFFSRLTGKTGCQIYVFFQTSGGGTGGGNV